MGYSVAEPEPVGAGTFWLELEPEQETEPVWRCEGKNNLLAYFYMKRSRSRWQKSTWSRSRSKKDRLRNTDGVGQDNFILPGWCKLVLLLCCCSNTNVVQAEVTEEEREPLVGHCRCKNCGIVPTPTAPEQIHGYFLNLDTDLPLWMTGFQIRIHWIWIQPKISIRIRIQKGFESVYKR